ncbi:hypothetical protein E2C01_092745 [Portunus trituberculatus]|uniref:Uncharacterized protein n=1 Tax=Portunus trituberculatus TaxID=210409 RepID=A0A5B7JL18_PORTR|nr:hypothetical protein [Portunus trituberculatus]
MQFRPELWRPSRCQDCRGPLFTELQRLCLRDATFKGTLRGARLCPFTFRADLAVVKEGILCVLSYSWLVPLPRLDLTSPSALVANHHTFWGVLPCGCPGGSGKEGEKEKCEGFYYGAESFDDWPELVTVLWPRPSRCYEPPVEMGRSYTPRETD